MTDALTMNVDSLATGRSMFPLTTRVSLIGGAADRMPSPFREIDLSERIMTELAALVKKCRGPQRGVASCLRRALKDGQRVARTMRRGVNSRSHRMSPSAPMASFDY